MSIVSHSLGCVITYDIMTGWDPVRFCLQEHHAVEEELDLNWMSYEERHLLEQLRLTRTRYSYANDPRRLLALPQGPHVSLLGSPGDVCDKQRHEMSCLVMVHILIMI